MITQKTIDEKRTALLKQQADLKAVATAAQNTLAAANRNLDHVTGALQILGQLEKELGKPDTP